MQKITTIFLNMAISCTTNAMANTPGPTGVPFNTYCPQKIHCTMPQVWDPYQQGLTCVPIGDFIPKDLGIYYMEFGWQRIGFSKIDFSKDIPWDGFAHFQDSFYFDSIQCEYNQNTGSYVTYKNKYAFRVALPIPIPPVWENRGSFVGYDCVQSDHSQYKKCMFTISRVNNPE